MPTRHSRTTSSVESSEPDLVNLFVAPEDVPQLREKAASLPSIQLTLRGLNDLELLACGAFSPLDRFMTQADYLRCLSEMRLANGAFFPVPLTLPLADEKLARTGTEITLRSPKNELLAVLTVEEAFECDPAEEERALYGVGGDTHSTAGMSASGRHCVTGVLRVLPLPPHRDYPSMRLKPAAVAEQLQGLGRSKVLGFASDQVMGREQEDFCRVACDANDAALLMQPVVGLERASGLDHFTLVRTYAVLARNYFEHDRALIALLPLATRHAGFREMLWRALVQRNYGATHVALPLGGEAEALLLPGYESELGVRLLAAPAAPDGAAAHDSHRPEVAAILLTSAPPRQRQGFCIWFTGLPSAGKSTIAEILAVMLQARGKRLTVLDGDVVRTHLSKGLGFSKEDRDTNILRIGYVASEIVHHHGAVICAAVSPYREARNRVRSLVGADNFVMVYVETPVDVCAERDVKGFYRRARAGELKGFTGVDDPYETPLDPDVRLTTTDCTPEQNARLIIEHLMKAGFLASDDWMSI